MLRSRRDYNITRLVRRYSTKCYDFWHNSLDIVQTVPAKALGPLVAPRSDVPKVRYDLAGECSAAGGLRSLGVFDERRQYLGLLLWSQKSRRINQGPMRVVLRLRRSEPVKKSLRERRIDVRFAASESVDVTIVDSGRKFSGKTLDISKNGLSFTSPSQLPLRSLVRVEVVDAMVLGEVRHCRLLRQDPLEYATGIAIQHVFFGWKQFYDKAHGE